MKTVRKKYDENATIESQFELKIYWAVREKEERKKGVVLIAPGDKFRVTAGKSLWVSDGYTLWQYNPQTNQVIIKKLVDVDFSSHPSQIISRYLAEYEYKKIDENREQIVAAWEPDSTSNAPFYTSITVWIDKKDAVIDKIHAVDRNKNESTYTFRKTRFGAQVNASVFEFESPEGVSVIDVR
jgi:outer membrane lipoprotein carrier protein